MAALPKEQLGPMAGLEHNEQVRQFESWIRSGHRPDTHVAVRDIRHGLPDTKVPPRVVGEAKLIGKVAKSEYIGCSSCRVARKFKDDGWCVNYGDGYFYLIGPECWESDELSAAIRVHQKILIEQDSDKRVAKFHSQFPEWQALLQLAAYQSSLLREAQRILKRDEVIWDRLVSARKSGGSLQVRRYRTYRDYNGEKRTRPIDETLGTLSGQSFLATPLPIERKVSHAENMLKKFIGEDIALDALERRILLDRKRGRLATLRRQIIAAEDALRDTAYLLIETCEFFRQKNINLINSWIYETEEEKLGKLREDDIAALPILKTEYAPSRFRLSGFGGELEDRNFASLLSRQPIIPSVSE